MLDSTDRPQYCNFLTADEDVKVDGLFSLMHPVATDRIKKALKSLVAANNE